MWDRELDLASNGPTWLKDPRIADVVKTTLFNLANEWKIYDLFAWAIMYNHVHVLLFPIRPMQYITRTAKGITAREASKILGRAGAFWQLESYGRWVRTEVEFNKIVKYIEYNPVKAGLVERVEDYKWSSAHEEWQAGGPPHRQPESNGYEEGRR